MSDMTKLRDRIPHQSWPWLGLGSLAWTLPGPFHLSRRGLDVRSNMRAQCQPRVTEESFNCGTQRPERLKDLQGLLWQQSS
jgi:hypothetical protein